MARHPRTQIAATPRALAAGLGLICAPLWAGGLVFPEAAAQQSEPSSFRALVRAQLSPTATRSAVIFMMRRLPPVATGEPSDSVATIGGEVLTELVMSLRKNPDPQLELALERLLESGSDAIAMETVLERLSGRSQPGDGQDEARKLARQAALFANFDLAEAAELYQRSLAINANALDVATELASAKRELGDPASAAELLRRATRLSSSPIDQLAWAWIGLGRAEFDLGALSQAAEAFLNARRFAEQSLAKAGPGQATTEARLLLARTLMRQGDAAQRLERLEEARSHYEAGKELLGLVSESDPLRPRVLRELHVFWTKLGEIEELRDRNPEAEKAFQAALALIREARNTDREAIRWRRDESIILERLTNFALNSARREDARTLANAVLSIRSDLASQVENNRVLMRELAVAMELAGVVAVAEFELELAGRFFGDQHNLLSELLQIAPDNLVFRHDLGINRYQTGRLYWDMGEPEKAARALSESIQIYDEVLARQPDSRSAQRDKIIASLKLGYVLSESDRLLDAGRVADDAVKLAVALQAASPKDFQSLRLVHETENLRGDVAFDLREMDVARIHYEAGRQIAQSARVVAPDSPDALWLLYLSHWQLASLKDDDAATHGRAAILLLEERIRSGAGTADDRAELEELRATFP